MFHILCNTLTHSYDQTWKSQNCNKVRLEEPLSSFQILYCSGHNTNLIEDFVQVENGKWKGNYIAPGLIPRGKDLETPVSTRNAQ